MNTATPKLTAAEYQERAVALESPTNDADTVNIPWFDIATLIEVGRKFDLIKRECFYAKKPDDDRMIQYAHFVEQTYTQNYDLEARGLTFGAIADLVPTDLAHALLGKVTEVCELFEALFAAVRDGVPLDLDNLQEEFGDEEWYGALARKAAERLDGGRGRFAQPAIQAANLAKLEQRYGKNAAGTAFGGDRDYGAERAAMDAAVPTAAAA